MLFTNSKAVMMCKKSLKDIQLWDHFVQPPVESIAKNQALQIAWQSHPIQTLVESMAEDQRSHAARQHPVF